MLDKLLVLLKTMEQDEAVKPCEFLTDGDPDEFPDSLKAVEEFFEIYGFSHKDSMALKAEGYSPVKGDCFCFHTAKGIINTGVDDF